MAKVNLDKIQAKGDGNIATIRGGVDLPNGSLVTLNDLHTGEREAYTFGTADPKKSVLLVATPEFDYASGVQTLDHVNLAGTEARAYHLVNGDMFQVERALADKTTYVVGDVLVGDADGYGYVDGSAVTDAKVTFKVEALTTFGFDRREMYLLTVHVA